ncbi:MAG: hypothetical protein ABH840_04490 [Nanoarchaeota archaeon]
MKKRTITINIIIIAMITLLTLIILLRFSSENQETEISCLEPRVNLTYEACYNIATSNISLKITNNENTYNLNRIDLEFRNPSLEIFQLFPLPDKGSTEEYSFNSEKNPVKLTLKENLEKTPSEICNESTRIIILKYCDYSSKAISIDLKIGNNSPTDLPKTPAQITLPGKSPEGDIFYGLSCESNWACTAWEECIDGIQRRDCSDLSRCLIPSYTPDFTRFCDNSCKENWQCEWSKCINGYTKPTCKYLSNCNTEYSKPSIVPCSKNTACIPKIYCTEWSDCSISYKFEDLLSGIEELRGKKSRYCVDSNKCILPIVEEDYCSIKVDITTKEVTICGKRYLEIRNRLDGKLLSRIDYSKVSNKLDLTLFISKEQDITC